jgi:glucosamine--fructose-6-phosphate aminotransferase (isomerizing)
MTAGAAMAAEMAEQPEVLERLAAGRAEAIARVRAVVPEAPVGIVLVARGSSDNAAIYGRYVLELAARRPVALAAPSLVTRYGAHSDLDGWLAVGVSQSGRTPEIVSVLEELGRAGACTVAVTNDVDAPIAAAARATIGTAAGDERAVPATKTFTAQVAAFAILAEALGPVPWDDAAWDALPRGVAEVLDDGEPPARAAAAIGDAPGLIAVARGVLLSAALESALKLKETTALLAEGASVADFLHGPIAVVRGQLPVLAISARGPVSADVDALVEEVRARDGRVLTVADRPDADLPLPADVPEGLAAITASVRAQQVARELALLRGVDPDAPFGLSKVTATH